MRIAESDNCLTRTGVVGKGDLQPPICSVVDDTKDRHIVRVIGEDDLGTPPTAVGTARKTNLEWS